jgi:probable rRNA maturation factor
MNPAAPPYPDDHPMDLSPKPDITVELSDTQNSLRIEPQAIAATVRDVLTGEGIRCAEISLAMVDDATIHAVNRRHLNHDWPTDVITFALSEPDDPCLVAELVVSAEMAARTAAAAGSDPDAELTLYVVHGLLHLCGYDDQTDVDAQAMRQREAETLARLGVPNVFGRVPSEPEHVSVQEESPCSPS